MASEESTKGAILKGLVTQFLMVTILMTMTMAGAQLFMRLEGPHEVSVKNDIIEMRTDVIDALWNNSHRLSTNKAGFSKFAKEELKRYEAELYSAFTSGINSDSDDKVWDLWGSLVYSTTVFTTIGYGHICPVTKAGRIATMVYAMVGIPLCLIVLAEMGKFLTLLLKAGLSLLRKSPIDDVFDLAPVSAICIAAAYIVAGAAMYSQWEEDWDYFEGFYFVFVSISTIGFGDVLPGDEKYFLASYLYQLFGLALVAMVINVIMEVQQKHVDQAKVQMHQSVLGDSTVKKTQ